MGKVPKSTKIKNKKARALARTVDDDKILVDKNIRLNPLILVGF